MKNNTTKESRTTLSKVFKTIIWPRRKLMFIGLTLILISRLAALVLPWASKILLDEIIPNKDLQTLYNLLWFIGASILIQAITSFLLTKVLTVQAHYLIAKLRIQVQEKVLSLPISFFDSTKSGALVSRIMSDVSGVRNLIGTGLVQLVGGMITALISFILLVQISPLMTLFVFVPVGVFGYVALRAFKYIRPIIRTQGKINAEVKGRLTETLAGVRVIKGFNADKQEIENFKEDVNRLYQNVKKSLIAKALMTSSSTLLLGLASIGIMGIGGIFIIQSEMTIGEFLFFTLLLGFMIAPISQISNIGSQLTGTLAGLDRTEEIMSQIPEDEIGSRTDTIENFKGNLTFDNVSFSYEAEKDVINNISFSAPAGSVIALVGSSGSGKSTIAGLSASFLKPKSGKIYVDAYDLSKVKLSSYRKHLGVVLQEDFLFEGSIRENILFSNPNASNEELLNAVNTAYVNEFTDRFEDGLDTMIGERGIKLSGGQRQRIAISRAILANPKVIILDEATSNLDTESEALIQKSLAELVEGRTTIVIAHRLSTIKKADKILVIESGSIAESGTHDELISLNGRYHELYTYQSKI